MVTTNNGRVLEVKDLVGRGHLLELELLFASAAGHEHGQRDPEAHDCANAAEPAGTTCRCEHRSFSLVDCPAASARTGSSMMP